MRNTFLYYLYVPYKYLIFVPFLLASTTFLGILTLIISFFFGTRTASTTSAAFWARVNAYMVPMFLQVIGRENIDPAQSYVIAANHQSHIDILVMYGWIGVDFKWVMKQELRKIPVLGYTCDKLGHIYINRSRSQDALSSLEEAKKRIVNGTSVLFFPEGTRSPDGKIRAFKKGAFFFALDLKLPILPVSIVNTRNVLPARTLKLFPGRAKMVIHPPIPVDGYTSENMNELMDKTRQVIQEGLDKHAF